MITWSTASKKIVRWLAAGCDIPNGAVAWTGQFENLPKDPDGVPYTTWLSAKLLASDGVGTDWLRFEANPLELADDVVESVDAAANSLTLTAHAYKTGDGPVRLMTTGTLPAGLVLATDYWVVKLTANTIKLVASRAAAVADPVVAFVDITGVGVGTHTIVDTPDTRRVLEEIKIIAEGNRSAILSLQLFSDFAFGELRAQAVLERLRSSRTLPSQLELLRSAGFAVSRFGQPRVVGDTSASRSALFELRAVCEVHLNYVDGVGEAGTTIEGFEVEAHIDDSTGEELDVETFAVERDA